MTENEKLTIIHRFLTQEGVKKAWVARRLWNGEQYKNKPQNWFTSTITQKIRGMDASATDTINRQYWEPWEVDRLLEIRKEFMDEL